jgi:hypothetical protein
MVNLLGVDVGLQARRSRPGWPWRIGNQVDATKTGTSWITGDAQPATHAQTIGS